MFIDPVKQPGPGANEIAIIANPVAGSGRGHRYAERVQGAIMAQGIESSIYWTRSQGEATGIARDLVARGVPLVAACGGDGTLNEVSNALAGTETTLGAIPGGRGNDLCRALGIPRHPARAADILLHGAVKRIDLGRIGERYFNTIATLGFDAEVAAAVEAGGIPFSGPATYVYAILKTLRHYQSPMLELHGDFGTIQSKIFLVATANTAMYGGGMKITPGAEIDDGLFHLCIISDVSRGHVLRLLPRVFRGTHITHPAVRLVTTRRLEVRGKAAIWVYADGERFAQVPLTIEMVPQALKVMTPLPLE